MSHHACKLSLVEKIIFQGIWFGKVETKFRFAIPPRRAHTTKNT